MLISFFFLQISLPAILGRPVSLYGIVVWQHCQAVTAFSVELDVTTFVVLPVILDFHSSRVYVPFSHLGP